MSEALTIEAGSRDLHSAATPGTVVPCPLKGGAQIAVGRCVEWQDENGCHCEHALVSLRLVAALLEENPPDRSSASQTHESHAERIESVRALTLRAEQIERERPLTIQSLPTAAKEKRMPNSIANDCTDAEFTAAFEKANGSINETMSILGTTSWGAVKARALRMGLSKPKAKTPQAPPKAAEAPAVAKSGSSEDRAVVLLLQARTELLAKVAALDNAIEVLRG